MQSKQELEQRLLEKEQVLNYELDATKKEVAQAKNECEQAKNESDQRLLERERKLKEELTAAKMTLNRKFQVFSSSSLRKTLKTNQ